ncbi:hypothetical protein BV25DRAFT_1840107 [Artomyces pyxidatus]|uniref:Uncharacterized protein n=1 Tax=Artomyces pyxidatus TaxID=48021 RepID=A0ACB8SSS6_9AGAM|nr:hypothetical protein BV25DRAFT_1840107 [Artomyces pyxidatus]
MLTAAAVVLWLYGGYRVPSYLCHRLEEVAYPGLGSGGRGVWLCYNAWHSATRQCVAVLGRCMRVKSRRRPSRTPSVQSTGSAGTMLSNISRVPESNGDAGWIGGTHYIGAYTKPRSTDDSARRCCLPRLFNIAEDSRGPPAC